MSGVTVAVFDFSVPLGVKCTQCRHLLHVKSTEGVVYEDSWDESGCSTSFYAICPTCFQRNMFSAPISDTLIRDYYLKELASRGYIVSRVAYCANRRFRSGG